MSDYVVSARKYRPHSFDTVVGQSHITRTLLNEIKSQKLAQAFLFCGPRGVGKTTCARILAKEINREEGDELNDYSFNIFELDAASNNSVEDIRNLVDQVRIPPQRGNYKVYIIDEVHMLSSNAFNAFLKTLEEPPPYAIFILATTERHKILPTILSRCQIFNFERITVPQIVEHLSDICQKENVTAEPEALHLIAQKADGAMRDALSLFDQMVSFSENRNLVYKEVLENLNILDYDYYFRLTDAFYAQRTSDVLLLFDEIQKKGFDAQIFLNGLSSHFRDLLVCQSPDTFKLLEVPGNIAKKYTEQAAQMDYGFLINAIQITDLADQSYKLSNNQRLHVELVLIKLCHLNQAIQLADELKKKSAELKSVPRNEKISVAPKVVLKEPVKVTRLGNLKDILSGKKQLETPAEPEIISEVSDAPAQDAETIKHLSPEQLSSAIEKLAVHLESQDKKSAAATLRQNGHFLKNGIAYIELMKHEMVMFGELKQEVLQFLRSATEHPYLQIEFEMVLKARKEAKPFRSKDKLDAMIKNNPLLKELMDTFNLELED